MASDEQEVQYVRVVVGDPQPAWCDSCLTSAALTFGLYILGEDGPVRLGEGEGCPECGTGVFGDDDT